MGVVVVAEYIELRPEHINKLVEVEVFSKDGTKRIGSATGTLSAYVEPGDSVPSYALFFRDAPQLAFHVDPHTESFKIIVYGEAGGLV